MPAKKKAAAKKRRKSRKPAATAKMGRPAIYTPALGKRVCELIMHGATLRQITAEKGMPDKSTIIRWLADREKYADFCDQYARAHEVKALMMEDEILDIIDDGTNDWIERENKRTGETFVALNDESIQRSRARVEARKWLMAKAAPKRFGDRVALTGKDGGPIKHAHSALGSILDEMDGAETGLPPHHAEASG